MRKIFFILLFFFLIANSFANENYQLTDITEGSRNAKIKIYSYQSLTCPHCATFHRKVYPLIKKDYIDTGIVQIYFKPFPLDLAALNAAKIAQCVDKKKRVLSIVSGAILPLVALGFIKSLVDYIRPEQPESTPPYSPPSEPLYP